MNIKQVVKRNLLNLPGWRTSRKIVVIESDDWGSIRMPSKRSYESLIGQGIPLNKCPYNSIDSLESVSDLEALFEVLSSVSDINGKPPVLTANSVVVNPDFNKIKSNDCQTYYFEKIDDTFRKFGDGNDVLKKIKQGKNEKLFFPQFHGREHLNVQRWMNALKAGLPETRIAFEQHVFGVSTNITTEKRKSYLAAIDFENELEEQNILSITDEGLTIFEEIYGYPSISFIAPNYTWGDSILPILEKHKVRFIQGAGVQNRPKVGGTVEKVNHKLGEKNSFGQTYLIRNCCFEPAINKQTDILESTLRSIHISFFWHKPAIISAHRLNFVGGIDPQNRDRNLFLLRKLLQKIIKRWPDVEFMNSVELGEIIEGKNGK